MCKGPEAGWSLACWKTEGRSLWLEPNEGGALGCNRRAPNLRVFPQHISCPWVLLMIKWLFFKWPLRDPEIFLVWLHDSCPTSPWVSVKSTRYTGWCEDKREDMKIARTLLGTEQLLHKWHPCYCCAEEAEARLPAWQVPGHGGLRNLVYICMTMGGPRLVVEGADWFSQSLEDWLDRA